MQCPECKKYRHDGECETDDVDYDYEEEREIKERCFEEEAGAKANRKMR